MDAFHSAQHDPAEGVLEQILAITKEVSVRVVVEFRIVQNSSDENST